jgi:hypothetical protein
LIKVYTNDNIKYSRELYNILDVKLQAFYDSCIKVGLPENQYCNAFSIMLKDRARAFYYDKITGRTYNFITTVAIMKTHFETEENR